MQDETERNGEATGGPPAIAGESPFLDRLSEVTYEVTSEFGLGPNGNIDVFFVGFLRMMARFGVFSFGPITIYVPTVEEVARQPVPAAVVTEWLVRFSKLLGEEQRRIGGGPINELHTLLAFMKLNEGIPGRVFGELGVRPEQVEEFARSAGTVATTVEPEKLYSPEEAAEYLGIHVQTVRAWVRSGRLKASRLAGQRALRIKASDLMTVLEPLEASE